MKVRIELTDAGEPIEVLIINGGAEHIEATLTSAGDSCEVEVAAPQAVVLREVMA